ncbi:MAG: hypothetical protein RR848_04240 [Oscillospiraceae bacterium]
MEKAFAFICAQDDVPMRRLRQYCRRVYSLGYVCGAVGMRRTACGESN